MRAQSPLTGLPGNVRIEEEIDGLVESGDDFALLYADLDHFKAYNDHYGFMRGDQAIQATATLLEKVARDVTGGDAFVGHVGGDDFVLIVPPDKATDAAEAIVATFDQDVPALYDPEDRERGYVEVANRRGELQRFPMLSISIGIASTELRSYAHYAEAVAIATEMKTFTKTTAGSSWAIDRRTI
jgi:diguanylate cyclase (GGDEF)-like protein